MTLAEFLDSLQTTWPARAIQGAVQGAMAPGNAFASSWGNPVTTEQMVGPAANLAGLAVGLPGGVGGLGSGARIIDFNSAKNAAIRSANIKSVFGKTGGGIIKELPNGYMIGFLPGNAADVSHVLLAPQGGPILYGRSVQDLIRRGLE